MKKTETKMLEQNAFITEYNHTNYLIVELEPKYYVIFCQGFILSKTEYLNKIKSITNNFEGGALFVINGRDSKVDNILQHDNIVVNYMLISSFISNPLSHVLSPISIKKIDYTEIYKLIKIPPENLMHVEFTNPVIAWLRLKPGDIIEEKHRSPLNGIHIFYRIVVNS